MRRLAQEMDKNVWGIHRFPLMGGLQRPESKLLSNALVNRKRQPKVIMWKPEGWTVEMYVASNARERNMLMTCVISTRLRTNGADRRVVPRGAPTWRNKNPWTSQDSFPCSAAVLEVCPRPLRIVHRHRYLALHILSILGPKLWKRFNRLWK